LSKLQAATNSFESELHLIVKLYFRRDSKKALSLSTKLASHFEDFATIFKLCGAIHTALLQCAQAIENLQRAIEIEPNFDDLSSNMASVKFDNGDLDAAITAIAKLL